MFNFLRRMLTRTGRKSRTFRLMLNRLRFEPSLSGAEYKEYAQEAYEKNPYVYAAISQTANSCAGVPPMLFRITGQGRTERALQQFERRGHTRTKERRMRRGVVRRLETRTARHMQQRYGASPALARAMARKAMVEQGELEPVEGHELLDLLQHPNPWFQRSYQRFIQSFVSYLEIGGEAFIEPKKGGDRPQELYVLSPLRMRPIRGTDTHPIKEFEFRGDGRKVKYRYDPDPFETEIFYTHYFHPRDPLRGMSPAEAAAFSIDVNNEGRRWNLSLLQNNAMLSGIITAKGTMGTQQIESLRDQLSDRYGGADNAGKVLTVDDVEGLDWKPVSQTVKDMMWGDLNKITAREVSIVWNVPPEILGDSEQKTYANYQESRRAFYLEKVIPLLDYVYGELNTHLVPFYGSDLVLSYDLESVDALQEDVNEMHERVRKDVKEGIITREEGREALGWDPYEGEGADRLFVPTTVLPIEDAVSLPEPQGGNPEGNPEDEEDEQDGDPEDEERARPANGHQFINLSEFA